MNSPHTRFGAFTAGRRDWANSMSLNAIACSMAWEPGALQILTRGGQAAGDCRTGMREGRDGDRFARGRGRTPAPPRPGPWSPVRTPTSALTRWSNRRTRARRRVAGLLLASNPQHRSPHLKP